MASDDAARLRSFGLDPLALFDAYRAETSRDAAGLSLDDTLVLVADAALEVLAACPAAACPPPPPPVCFVWVL